MKRNQFFNLLTVQHFKDTIPKFQPCLKKIGDFITPENCAILLSKMVFQSRGQNVLMTWCCGQDFSLQYDTACIGYTQHQYPRRHLKIQRKLSIQNRSLFCLGNLS